MGKDKKSSKVAAPAPKPVSSKPLESVKESRVTKPADKPKAVAREAAKKAAKKVEKQSKKKREPSPSSSENDAETSESSASSESDSEVETKAAPKVNGANGAAKAPATKAEESSDASSDGSDSDEDSEVEAAKKAEAPKTNGAAAAAAADHSDDSLDASDSEVETKAGAKQGADVEMDDDSSDSGSSDEEDESEKPKANGHAAHDAAASSDASSSDDDEDEIEEDTKPVVQEQSKKRKADAVIDQTPKKTKVTVDGEQKEATANLFIGNLSWNVDEEWLTREFEEFGELKGVRIITDRDSGRSKGFGYVEFTDVENAITALEAKNGSEFDGRNIRVDFSPPREQRQQGQTPQQRSTDRAQRYGDVPKEPSATLFVGNIAFDADQQTISEYFEEHGTVVGVRLITDRETGQPKGFGYVEMGSIDDAKAAFEALNGVDVAGRSLRLDYSTPRPANNDSRGGGFGGGRGGGRGRGGFGDRGRGGRGGFGDRGRGRGRGDSRGGSFTKNRGGFGDFSGKKTSF